MDSPVAQTVCNFFRSWDPEQALDQPAVAKLAEEFYKGGNLVFEVDGNMCMMMKKSAGHGWITAVYHMKW